jgi:hypothetical protein
MEEIPTGEEVSADTFFLNECPIIILFDFGSSHDFMSATCNKKAKLSLMASGAPYMISTPGGSMDADSIVWKVPLDLIILSGQGIDVILAMSGMKWYKAVLDISARFVDLNSPMYVKITLHLPAISHIKASLYHVVERKIEEIHVFWEFRDVFPDDLLGMPPDQVQDWVAAWYSSYS